MEETREEQINKEYMIQHFSTDPSFLIEDICEDFKDCVASSLLGIKAGCVMLYIKRGITTR